MSFFKEEKLLEIMNYCFKKGLYGNTLDYFWKAGIICLA